ncbi:hypothetical protein SUDANB95_03456 [Actinosynnema sp. ALI-1.44]
MTNVATNPAAVTEEDIEHLPEPARRYLRFTRVLGRPADGSFDATVRGHFRLRPGQNWLACTTWQHDDAPTLSRDFRMRLMLAHLIPVQATDVYAHGHGHMRATALGMFTLADGQGPEFDAGELVTLLNDAVLLAPSMLLRMPVHWTPVDERTFGLALTDHRTTVTAQVTVDDRGAPVEFSTEDRWAALPTGLVRARWSTPVDGWCLVADRIRPRRATAVWHLPDGPFTYAQFDLTRADITFGP